MQIIDLTKLFLPDNLIVIESALLLICIKMQIEQRFDFFKETGQAVYIKLGGWFVHTLIVAVVFVLVGRISSRMYCLSL